MLYIIKTFDERYKYLKDYCLGKYNVIYDDKSPINYEIEILFLPLEGLDEFGYIKGSNINLENFLQLNKVSKVYTGNINEKLKELSKRYSFSLFSFYDDLWYCSCEFDLKIEIIKFFLSDKLHESFENIKILVVGNDYKAYVVKERLKCDIFDNKNVPIKSVKNMNFDAYDAIVKFQNIDFSFNKIIIEMQDMYKIDLLFLLQNKEIYYINHLQRQYLTKTGGKILYDCMVRT